MPHRPQTAALLLGAAFLFLAGGMLGLLLPLRADLEGFTPGLIGLMGSAYAAGYITGCLTVPRLVLRVGQVRTFGALAVLVAIAALLHALLVLPLPWLALRALAGFAMAGSAMIIESWLNEAASPAERGRIFGRYMLVNLVGGTAGQLAIGLSGAEGFEPFAAIAILGCLALLPTALSGGQAPQPLTQARLELGRLFRVSPIAAVGCFGIGLANGAFGTLGALWARSIGLGIGTAALFTSAAVVGGAIAQTPMGRLSDRMDRRFVLLGGTLLAATASLLFLLVQPATAPAAIALGLLLGAAMHALYPIALAHASDLAPEGSFVTVGGGLLLLFGAGAALGPALAALSLQRLGPDGIFAFLLAVYLLLAGYGIWRLARRRPAVAARHRVAWLSLPRALTPETASLDPRAA
jgi:MFS family permease